MRWLIVHPGLGPQLQRRRHAQRVGEALRGLGEQVMESQLDARLTFFDSALMPDETAQADSEGRRPARKALTSEQAVELACGLGCSASAIDGGRMSCCASPRSSPRRSCWRSCGPARPQDRHAVHRVALPGRPAAGDGQVRGHQPCSNDPATLDEYQAVCPVAEYMPHSYRPSVHHPLRPGTVRGTTWRSPAPDSRPGSSSSRSMNLAGLDVALGGFWGRLPADSPLRAVPAAAARRRRLHRQHRDGRPVPAGDARGSTSTAARASKAAPTGAGRAGPARSRWPRAGSGSPATPGRKATSCSRCCRPSPARRKHPTSSGGRSRTRTSGNESARQARAAIEGRTFENAAKRLLRLLDQQKGT